MLESVVIAGVASGFAVYLLRENGPMPIWWSNFIRWLANHGVMGGKPFTCSVCMSFWISAFIVVAFQNFMPKLANMTIHGYAEGIVILLCVSGFSVLYYSIVDRLNTVYL